MEFEMSKPANRVTKPVKGQNMSYEMYSSNMMNMMQNMQGMMGNYVEQSKSVFTQMQEQMQKQSEQMLSAFGLKR